MAAGDAQRVWFPEMIARLKREWGEPNSFEAVIELCASLDAVLHQISTYVSRFCPKQAQVELRRRGESELGNQHQLFELQRGSDDFFTEVGQVIAVRATHFLDESVEAQALQ